MKTENEFQQIFAEIMNEKGSGNVFRTCYEFYKAGYEEALTDNEQLYCEVDNLHNLTFWLRLKNHELIIGEF